MAEVAVRIAGREYKLGCADGEEAGLAAYAGKMDGIANAIQRRMGQPIPEGRLLVMVGMTLADELADAGGRADAAGEDAVRADDGAAGGRRPSGETPDKENEKEIAARVSAIADRIERLSLKLA